MKKIIILLLSLLLVSCSTISTVVESAYTGVPTWAIKTPEKKGYIYFVTKSSDETQNQRINSSYRELLTQISTKLGYEVTGTYYRELSTLGTISDLGLEIVEKKELDGVLYLLAEADESIFNSKRSEEYKAELERISIIDELSEKALQNYKDNNDIASLNCWISAAAVLDEGKAGSYSKDELLSKAVDIAKSIKFTLKNENPKEGKCTLVVSRDRGALSPRVINAPILITIMVHDFNDEYYQYTYREVTDEKGMVEFYKKYPKMADVGSVTFSLDLENDSLISEQLIKEVEETTISFNYAIESKASREGIVIAFSEWDENGELLSSSYSADAFKKYLEKDGIKITSAVINGSEYEDVIKGAQERFPDKKYLIWSRVGRNTINKTVGGDYVTSSQGYTILSDIESGEMIYYDYTSQSVAWGPDLDEVSRELFTSYGKLIASQITRYL
ncbi:MAG: hypothetical protein PUH25_04075 [Spirochaetales bacterium]|uniref:hypothetical protein n=1 Tax=Bullifex sp. TaxID=2815808 RepID=UPI002A5404C6|nr:hypothetical protein [Bullifex sp.]MDD5973566.1 hypothetical protein [Spirochaetales bacterium]MDD7271042.1 hypothetical protein [Spirochaetales bacterium]MDY4067352.1 hypothetical protein [Bullifex sp.]